MPRIFPKFSEICPELASKLFHLNPVRAEKSGGRLTRSKMMKTRNRFLKSVVKTAKTTHVAMPWERGARRAAFVAARTVKPLELKRA